jgi:hypothetical protein
MLPRVVDCKEILQKSDANDISKEIDDSQLPNVGFSERGEAGIHRHFGTNGSAIIYARSSPSFGPVAAAWAAQGVRLFLRPA